MSGQDNGQPNTDVPKFEGPKSFIPVHDRERNDQSAKTRKGKGERQSDKNKSFEGSEYIGVGLKVMAVVQSTACHFYSCQRDSAKERCLRKIPEQKMLCLTIMMAMNDTPMLVQ